MRKKPRGQHNVRRGERKKNNMAQVARTKMYQKAKNRGNRKKVWGISKRKKDNGVKTHKINKKLRF